MWNKVQEQDFDAPFMAKLLCQEYEVTPEIALADATELLNAWHDAGLCE